MTKLTLMLGIVAAPGTTGKHISARKTVSPMLPSIAVVLAIAGVTMLLPVAFTDTAHARNHKQYRSDPPPVTRSGVAEPTKSKFGGAAVQSSARIDLGLDFVPSGPRAQHQDHRSTTPATQPPPRRRGN